LLLDWQAYDAMTPRVRSGEISPVINKIQPLLAHDRLRAVFGQRIASLDVNAVASERKILLVALPKGELGEEASRLIGSVFVSLFWRAILARSAQPSRPDFFFHIDEAPSYLNLPVSLDEMLAQGRAYRAGFTLAFQSTSQFSATQRSGILANARNKVVFRTAHEDARVVGKELGLEHPEELQRLRRYEVMVQLMTDDGPSRATTGSTLPLSPPTGLAEQIRAASAARYGRPRKAIIEELDRDYRAAEVSPAGPIRGLEVRTEGQLQPVGLEV
jgi:type IV secretory pathway TraG/TraD family ATPase VirD4